MAARLGEILYCIGWIMAAIVFLPFGYLAAIIWEPGPSLSLSMAGLLLAAIPWAIGWALRYILKGPADHPLPDIDAAAGEEINSYSRRPGELVFRGIGRDPGRFSAELAAVLLHPKAGEKLVRAANEGNGVIRAKQWAEITRGLG